MRIACHCSKLPLLLLLLATCTSASNNVCDKCQCDNNGVIDCNHKNLSLHFETADWPNKTLIKQVILDYNSLVRLTTFPPMDLVNLSVSHNRISRIEDGTFMNLQNMTHLDLSHNQLTSQALSKHIFTGLFAPSLYRPLKSLTSLDLSSNALHTLDQDQFQHLPELRILNLASNDFAVVDRPTTLAIASVSTLEVLDLSYNNLRKFSDSMLYTLLHLKSLLLKGNSLKFIPDDFGDSQSLEELVLDDNPIETLDSGNIFPRMSQLKILHMSHMPNLTSIGPHSLSHLVALEEFHCNNNHALRNIDLNAFTSHNVETEVWPPLTQVWLNNNNLTSLDSHLIARWDKLNLLDIQGNPWMCDCRNQWMVTTLTKVRLSFKPNLMEGVICREPEEMRGMSVLNLGQQNYEMRCVDANGAKPEKDGAMLIGVLVGVLIAIPATLAIILVWRRWRHGFVMRRNTSGSDAVYKRADSMDEFS